MFQIMCGEYEDIRPVEMDQGEVVFDDREEAEYFAKVYNLGCTMNCDRAFVEEIGPSVHPDVLTHEQAKDDDDYYVGEDFEP